MLVILFGPSCSGKTTMINKLCLKYSFKPIRTYTTRIIRPMDKLADFGRVAITKEEFVFMQEKKQFAFVNGFFNNLYGTSQEDIDNSQEPNGDIYVLDYSITKKEDFTHLICNKLVIKPTTEFDLTQWILGTNRVERMNQILEDYRLNYTDEKMEYLKKEGFIVFINKFGILDSLVDDIYFKVAKK